MSKLSNDIKEYIKGDYLTGEEYGKWGILTQNQRRKIKKLCELCDVFETSADNFYNELEQKDQRIAELEKQLAIRDKALELAVREELNTYQFTLGATVKTRCSEWLEQAEEALKKAEGK